MTTRNVRLNNPGNIRLTSPPTQWVGLASVQADPEYVTFVAPQYGFRAMARVLRNYDLAGVRQTVTGYITKWAPPKENNTAAYIRDVAKHVGVLPDAVLNSQQRGVPLLRGMAIHEGGCPWSDDIIALGIELEGAG